LPPPSPAVSRNFPDGFQPATAVGPSGDSTADPKVSKYFLYSTAQEAALPELPDREGGGAIRREPAAGRP
jgi:hypothetical protein